MSRVLLDHNLPQPLRRILPGHEVSTAKHLGWARLTNGDLLAAAERAGFEVMVTGDQGIKKEQNMAGRSIAVVELSTNYWPHLRDHGPLVAAAISAARPGVVTQLDLPRPPRSHPGPSLGLVLALATSALSPDARLANAALAARVEGIGTRGVMSAEAREELKAHAALRLLAREDREGPVRLTEGQRRTVAAPAAAVGRAPSSSPAQAAPAEPLAPRRRR